LSLTHFLVKDFRFEGNTVFSDEMLGKLVAVFRNKSITSEELQQVPALLTRHYVNNGYANSGALIPDQDASSGIITIRIIEGWVSRIELEGNQAFHTDYLTQRFQTADPFNILLLEERIQLLQRNPVIQKINANLGAGFESGEGVLRVQVEENKPYEAGVRFDNRRSPSVGSKRFEMWGVHHSLSGWGDTLEARYSLNQGPDDYQVRYTRPVSANDSAVIIAYEKSGSLVSEAPFNALDIESKFNRYYLAYRYPFINSLNRNLNLSVELEHRHSRTYVLGQPYSFAPGVIDGESKVTVLHFVQEWLDRSQSEVLSLRSDFKFGIDMFDATKNSNLPDGEFVAWSGQAQWIKRLNTLGSSLYLRALVQRTNDDLLPSEKAAIGGMETVRGYRESTLTRDQALILSAEWRIPVKELLGNDISEETGNSSLELALFYDYGEGSNKFLDTSAPENISSAGFGFLWQPTENISAVVYMGFNLRGVTEPNEYDLQDDGIHFQFGMKLI
jgi:hemolysin activation/secretion protein